jgi:hypothetical protein
MLKKSVLIHEMAKFNTLWQLIYSHQTWLGCREADVKFNNMERRWKYT